MTSYRQLTATSIIEPLSHYIGNLETTLINGNHYLWGSPRLLLVNIIPDSD